MKNNFELPCILQTHLDSEVALEFLDKVLEEVDWKEEEESDGSAAAYERGLISGITGCYYGPDQQDDFHSVLITWNRPTGSYYRRQGRHS